MSYYKVKAISLNKKQNKIMVNCASSNVFPITYRNSEYFKDESVDFNYKLGQLLRDISGGNLQLNESCYKWNYAIAKTNAEVGYYLYSKTEHKYTLYYIGAKPFVYSDGRQVVEITQEQANNGEYKLLYEYDGNKQYYKISEKEQDDKRIAEILETYTEVFLKYYNEKHNSKYYLYSNRYGVITPKGNKGAFYYDIYKKENANKMDVMDYYKAFCLAINCKRDNHIVSIVEYGV